MREENRERISPKTAPAARKVGLLLIPQFSNLGLALVMEPLVLANLLMQR